MEEKDLAFLKQVCGEQLDQPMGLSQVEADEEGNLIRVEGILRPYSQKIVRKRLRKRYVLAEVGLFGRQETVFIWDLSARRSDLGREKINTAETLSTTVKTAGGRLR